MTRRFTLRAALAAVLLAAMSVAVAAWPERVVQYVIPFAAGRRIGHRGATASRGVQGEVRQGHGRRQQGRRRRRRSRGRR